MDYVAEAISFVRQRRPKKLSAKAFSAMSAGVKNRSSALETSATGKLRALKHASRKRQEVSITELVPAVGELPDSLVIHANFLWRMIGGEQNPERAHSLLAAARVEFARCQFHDAMWLGLYRQIGVLPIDERAKREMDTASEYMTWRNWCDADAIANEPKAQWCTSQSAGFGFHEWLATLGDVDAEKAAYEIRAPSSLIHPTPSAEELLSAIALSWVDAAAFKPAQALWLLAEAADASRDAGFLAGWDGHEKMVRDEGGDRIAALRVFAQLGTEARHAANRAAREKARSLFQLGNYPSKDRAAEEIAPRLGVAFRTARDWLKGA